MIARDQQAALGLIQTDVVGGVAGGLVHRPDAEVGLDLDPGDEVTVGFDGLGDARRHVLDLLGVGVERGLGDAALAGYLETTGEDTGAVRAGVTGSLVAGVHPELAAGAIADRRRLTPVVAVGVGAGEELHVLEPEVDLVHGPLELGQRAGLVHAGVDQDYARAGGDRPRVAVRNPRPRQRQAQAPETG